MGAMEFRRREPLRIEASTGDVLTIPDDLLAALSHEDYEALLAGWLRTYVGPRAQDETVTLIVERGD